MTTTAQALKLYATACETHKRADWRIACHALASALQGQTATPKAAAPAKEPRAPKPVSLLQFLAKYGLRDEGGELRARDAEIWHKGKALQLRLVRPDGISLEEAADRALCAGYFPHVPPAAMDDPDNMHPVTAEDLIRAIERELGGRPVLTAEDDDAAYLASLQQDMDRYGAPN